MRLLELRLENLRNIDQVSFEPANGVNVLTGPNGAGKTSILEGIYLLSHTRSFRTRRAAVLAGSSVVPLSVFGLVDRAGGVGRVGLQWEDDRWIARIDGVGSTLAQLLERCAVVCFEPGSHALLSGPGEERRRFIDWGVFHVEHRFVELLRRYRRVLRQRNAALRENVGDGELAAWDRELVESAGPVTEARSEYLRRFAAKLAPLFSKYLPELGEVHLRLRSGWPVDLELAAALLETRALDRQRAHTTRGPHRADWSISFAHARRHDHLSRGQEKLCAVACMMAQAELYRDDHAEWPIILLDDLPSELDDRHQDAVLATLTPSAQIFLTSTSVPPALQRAGIKFRQFHVEQGRIQSLL